MRGPTAVGTTCLRASCPVLGQVGAGIRSRKLHPILVYPWGSWGSQSLIQHASLAATIVAAVAVAAEKCSKATSTAWYPPAHPLVLW